MCTIQELERLGYSFSMDVGSLDEIPTINLTIPITDLNKIHIVNEFVGEPVYLNGPQIDYMTRPTFQKISPFVPSTPTVFNTSKDFRENIVDRCLAEIEDICIYNDRAVIMKFKDGTYTKAQCTENDCFDLDMGLLICFIRKALCDTKENRNFRKFMRKLHKFIKNKEKEELKKEEEIQKTKAQKKRNKMDDIANIIIRAINGSALSKQRMEDSNNE